MLTGDGIMPKAKLVKLEPGSNVAWKALLAKAKRAMANGKEVRLPTKCIRRMKGQPRTYFNRDSIIRLKTSIQEIGQIYPGIIRRIKPEGAHEYELLDGERRWTACQLADEDYRAILVEVDDESIPYIIAAVANFNRENHTPIEISDAIEHMAGLDIPMEEIAGILGISSFWAIQIRGLQELIPAVRAMLDPTLPKDQLLPITAAIHISKADKKIQLSLAKKVLQKQVSLKMLRSTVISESKKAGTGLRVIRRSPHRMWISALRLAPQLSRVATDLDHILDNEEVRKIAKSRSRREVEATIAALEKAREIMAISLRQLRGL